MYDFVFKLYINILKAREREEKGLFYQAQNARSSERACPLESPASSNGIGDFNEKDRSDCV